MVFGEVIIREYEIEANKKNCIDLQNHNIAFNCSGSVELYGSIYYIAGYLSCIGSIGSSNAFADTFL